MARGRVSEVALFGRIPWNWSWSGITILTVLTILSTIFLLGRGTIVVSKGYL